MSGTDIDINIAHGRRVLAQEIEGLSALQHALDANFATAVDMIYRISPKGKDELGRVIVTGMGKSGHIARKIAATFASTGTPAHFVHPAEASHGDLGMITQKNSVVLALSNSGETPELTDIIIYCKRFQIPLISIVGRGESMLAREADVPLILPDVPEASPVNAPTTSTTMMLALGDALAVALLERRGFSRDDFAVYHPGGKLGKAFLRVENLMHTGSELPLVPEDLPMRDVLLTITAKRFGCAGVVNHAGNLQGVITDGDLRRHIEGNLLEKPACDIMTASPVTIRKDALAAEALGMMNERSITSLFVTDDRHHPIGILHIHDVLRSGVA